MDIEHVQKQLDMVTGSRSRLLRCAVCYHPIRMTREQFESWDGPAFKVCPPCHGDYRE